MTQKDLNKKTIIFITVDVEAHSGISPINNLIWGKLKDGLYGITKIMDVCDEFSMKATFFVDIAESKTYGEKALRDIFNTISNQGHDIQLHIHPDHWLDRNRLFLWEYTLDEQLQIISECKELFRKFLGENPIAFRAGKYGANYDTLKVLKKCKIPIDTSMVFLPGYDGCKLIDPPLTKNSIKVYNDILEIPVTVFRGFRLGSIDGPFTRYERLDINYAGLREMRFIIENAPKYGLKILILCLHSYSFVKKCKRSSYKPNFKDLEKFRSILEYIKTKENLEVLTFKQFYNKVKNKEIPLVNSNKILEYDNKIDSYIQTFKRAFKAFKKSAKAKIFVIGNILIIVTMIISCGLVFYHIVK